MSSVLGIAILGLDEQEEAQLQKRGPYRMFELRFKDKASNLQYRLHQILSTIEPYSGVLRMTEHKPAEPPRAVALSPNSGPTAPLQIENKAEYKLGFRMYIIPQLEGIDAVVEQLRGAFRGIDAESLIVEVTSNGRS